MQGTLVYGLIWRTFVESAQNLTREVGRGVEGPEFNTAMVTHPCDVYTQYCSTFGFWEQVLSLCLPNCHTNFPREPWCLWEAWLIYFVNLFYMLFIWVECCNADNDKGPLQGDLFFFIVYSTAVVQCRCNPHVGLFFFIVYSIAVVQCRCNPHVDRMSFSCMD